MRTAKQTERKTRTDAVVTGGWRPPAVAIRGWHLLRRLKRGAELVHPQTVSHGGVIHRRLAGAFKPYPVQVVVEIFAIESVVLIAMILFQGSSQIRMPGER